MVQLQHAFIGHISRQIDKQTDRHKDRNTKIQADRPTHTWTDTQTVNHREIS